MSNTSQQHQSPVWKWQKDEKCNVLCLNLVSLMEIMGGDLIHNAGTGSAWLQRTGGYHGESDIEQAVPSPPRLTAASRGPHQPASLLQPGLIGQTMTWMTSRGEIRVGVVCVWLFVCVRKGTGLGICLWEPRAFLAVTAGYDTFWQNKCCMRCAAGSQRSRSRCCSSAAALERRPLSAPNAGPGPLRHIHTCSYMHMHTYLHTKTH